MGKPPNSQPVSDAVKEMAQELAREYHIRPLGEDEQRPDGYYSVDHYFGGALKKPLADKKNNWLR
jgi:hypothetical protein